MSKAEPLIDLRRVSVALNGKSVLQDLKWSLRPNEHWLVRGANGSGKSTFLRLLRAEVWPEPNRGERIYRLDGTPQMTAVDVQRHVALVSPELQQRYLQQEWNLTARDVIETGFAQTDFLHVKLTSAQTKRVESLGRRFGLVSLLGRNMQTLSTGELRKVLIARAVIGAPKLLLLDEVCDGLDAKFRGELLAMIESIARHGTQIVYTTHRADEALSVITHELEFAAGHILRQGKAPRRKTQSPARGRAPEISADVSCNFRTGLAGLNGSPLIRIENADVYLDRTRVLRGIRWNLSRGEHWVVLGSNGAGKTSFLKLIASDLYPAFGGRVSRFEFTAESTIWNLRRRIGCVSPLLQAHYREPITAEQVVVSGFFSSVGLMDRPTPRQRTRVQVLLGEFGLGHLGRKSMIELSFGEMRKILTLRAIVHEPELLLLDEPFDGLDAAAKTDFARALEQIARRGTQLVVVTHHLADLPRCITHGLFLARGRIVAAGEWASIRGHPRVQSLFPGEPG